MFLTTAALDVCLRERTMETELIPSGGKTSREPLNHPILAASDQGDKETGWRFLTRASVQAGVLLPEALTASKTPECVVFSPRIIRKGLQSFLSFFFLSA